MKVNENACIHCGLCKKVCQIEDKQTFNSPGQLYVGWSLVEQYRKCSASGGIAASIYEDTINSGGYVCGVSLDKAFHAFFSITNDKSKIWEFQNSKYVFSDVSTCYQAVREKLVDCDVVLFIGLPCQVAAMKKYLSMSKCQTDSLITADIVCHGTPVPDYLEEHINSIQSKIGFQAKTCFFRDPKYGTSKYAFTIYDESILSERTFAEASPKYKKYVDDTDVYQIGYHNGFIYRDCCYECPYTRHERIGDITLFDSTGLGKVAPYRHTKENTSFILVNNSKGQLTIESAVNAGYIFVETRPIDEAIKYNGQLNKPCAGKESRERAEFLKMIDKGFSFDEAASMAFRNQIKTKSSKIYRMKRSLKKIARSIIPASLIDYVSIVKNTKG